MTFRLGMLGPYRVERTEEYISGGSDNSYAEMIRVRGSKPKPPYFTVTSHLNKYSETELGLYLKERKNLWRPLEKILNERLDTHEPEIMIHFPISMFDEVSKIIPFVKKRGITDPDLARTIGMNTQFVKTQRHKLDQIDEISKAKTNEGEIIPFPLKVRLFSDKGDDHP